MAEKKTEKKNKMGPPLGNQNGLGCGRPARDVETLSKELLEWCQLEDSINLNAFCVSRKPMISPQRLSEYANDNTCFSEAMMIAKSAVASRREAKLNEGKLHTKAYDLNAAVYDYYIKKEKREQLEHEVDYKLKIESGKNVPPNDQIINQILDHLKK